MDYPNAKFLVYTCWKKDFPYKVAGSLLLDGALTEKEAKEKVELYKLRHGECNTRFPLDTKTRFIYIVNDPDLWTHSRVNSPLA